MENEQIANLMAEKMYGPSTTDTEFAFQLFVEKIVLPIDRDGYTHDEIKMWILDVLNKRDQVNNWSKRMLTHNE